MSYQHTMLITYHKVFDETKRRRTRLWDSGLEPHLGWSSLYETVPFRTVFSGLKPFLLA
jgi:hypothetical protein